MPRARATALSIAIAGDDPPSEFRIFAAGANETVKGTFLFDEAAAQSVMAEYEAHGIDLAIDYDHAMLNPDAPDPAQAGKAAGWFQLEVRNGELWAVNVRWTEPAAEALRRKEWRFMSPAFQTDEKGRVTSLLNVAITNLPATRRLEPLMAASLINALGANMLDAAVVKKALDALKTGDAEAAMSLLEEIIAQAAGAPATEETPAEETPAEEMNDAPAEEEEEETAAVAASVSWLTRETRATSLSAAIDIVKTWKASHLKLEAETAKLAKERAALEADERDRLTIALAGKLGPAVAWADPLKATDRAKRKPAEPFASMSIAGLRSFVAKLGASAPVGKTPPTPPHQSDVDGDGSKEFQTPHGPVTLSASELRECERAGAKPEVYAANKARRLKKK